MIAFLYHKSFIIGFSPTNPGGPSPQLSPSHPTCLRAKRRHADWADDPGKEALLPEHAAGRQAPCSPGYLPRLHDLSIRLKTQPLLVGYARACLPPSLCSDGYRVEELWLTARVQQNSPHSHRSSSARVACRPCLSWRSS